MDAQRLRKVELLTALAVGLVVSSGQSKGDDGVGPNSTYGGWTYNGYYGWSDTQATYGAVYGPSWWHHGRPAAPYPGYHGTISQPIIPSDWGCGPYGPRHNLSASQHNPSGLRVWWY